MVTFDKHQKFQLLLCGALFVPGPVEPSADTPDASKEPEKKKQKGHRREAASQRLLAAGHKIKYVFMSGWAGSKCVLIHKCVIYQI